MPMSTVRCITTVMRYDPRTPPDAPSMVTIATSAKRPSVMPSVEPALKPNQPNSRMNIPRPRMNMLWPGIGRFAPSGPNLPRRGPSISRPASAPVAATRGAAGGVDGRRAGEVLHADVRLQPAAAEHPVRRERIDEADEHDGEGHVGVELDPLERRAPDDAEGHAGERALEEPLRLDQRVGQAHDPEGLLRITVALEQEARRADDVAVAEGEGEAAG